MSNGVNKAILVGNLGKNPEIRYTASSQAVASFAIATSETYKDKGGTKQTKTVWHNIVIWGKLAEIANKFLKKGSTVYLEGKINNRSYDDRDGNKKYLSEIIADKMIMLAGTKQQAADDNSTPPPEENNNCNGQDNYGPLPDENELPF